MNGSVRVNLVPYDPNWPRVFSGLARRIRGALAEEVLLLEHVGSTSVPGLSAKPLIDLVLAVADSRDEPVFVPPLEAEGFVFHRREPDWYQHRLLKTPDNEGNLHVFSRGCEEIERMLVFRDRLRTDEGDRKLYERTKQDLARRSWSSVQEYADAKSAVIREILKRAGHV